MLIPMNNGHLRILKCFNFRILCEWDCIKPKTKKGQSEKETDDSVISQWHIQQEENQQYKYYLLFCFKLPGKKKNNNQLTTLCI